MSVFFIVKKTENKQTINHKFFITLKDTLKDNNEGASHYQGYHGIQSLNLRKF